MERAECVVVGAGVIGLAVARALAIRGREVVILERAPAIGSDQSSRNNEVIHRGIYYTPGSPQAVLCVQGHRRLFTYCAEHGVAHARIGKLVVATEDEALPWLDDMQNRAEANGVDDLEWVGSNAVRRLEPEVACAAALVSPSTGIVDTHGLMLAFLGDAEDHGAALALRAAFHSASAANGGFDIQVEFEGGRPMKLHTRLLINAAGLLADRVARAVEAMPAALVPRIHFAKGAFFRLGGRSPFNRLIVPEQRRIREGGIFTLDLGGQGRFGPEEEWVETIDYQLDPARSHHVYAAVRSYFPTLPDGALHPDFTGIRARLNGPGEPMADWIFQGPHEHGVPGLVNLYGMESPGLTASLPIADLVAGMVEGAPAPFAAPGRYTLGGLS